MSSSSRATTLGLVLAAAGAAGCGGGPPMGTLTEGVAGPFLSLYSDLTKLQTADYEPYKFSDFYIQAVVNNVLSGDTITASLNQGGISRTFTAPQDGDVGLGFHFSTTGDWTPGSATATVRHVTRTVGSVTFTIKD